MATATRAMAYLLDINIQCDEAGCTIRAIKELRDWRNDSRGHFCRNHAKQRLRERERFEKNNPNLRQ